MRDIKIDVVANRIVLTKSFYEKTFDYESEEFAKITQIMEKFPSMTIAVRNVASRKSASEYKGISYKYMRAFITNLDSENLITFEKVIEHYKKHNEDDGNAAVFAKVRDWFCRTYPRHREMIVEAEPQRIVVENVVPMVRSREEKEVSNG